MKAFNFYKSDGISEVDIIIESPVSFEEAQETAVVVNVDDIALPVISIDKLIKMKSKTGRSVDRLDIEELRGIKALRERS